MLLNYLENNFAVYFKSTTMTEAPSAFSAELHINPFNYSSGGLRATIKLAAKPDSNSAVFPFAVLHETVYCSPPLKKHSDQMREAYRTLGLLGQQIADKIVSLVPSLGKSSAVITSLEEEDYITACLLLALRSVNVQELKEQPCDLWFKDIVANPASWPIITALKEYKFDHMIADPALQMAMNYCSYIIHSNRLRGVKPNVLQARIILGDLLEMAGPEHTFYVAPKKKKDIPKIKVVKTPIVDDNEPLPWK